jgi:hypothetical protein
VVLDGVVDALTTDGSAVFFVLSAGTGARLMRVPAGGGCARELAVPAGVRDLVVDAGHLYYAAPTEGLTRVSKDLTGPVERLGVAVSAALAGDEGSLYFVRGPEVVRLDKGGWKETRLTSWAGVTVLGLDEQAVYAGRPTTEMVRDDGTIVRGGGGIRRLPKDGGGGAAAELTTVSTETLAVAGGWIYFTFGPILARMSTQGGAVTEVGTAAVPRGLRAGGGILYAFGAHYVVGYQAGAPAGSPPRLSLAPPPEVSALAADAAGVYYAAGTPPAIFAVSP